MAPIDRLLLIMSAHTGRNSGVSAKDLAAYMRVRERVVRALVTEARELGHPICGTPKDGYFLASSAEELSETCDFLRNRAMHSLALEARLRRVPLPELIGQLRLSNQGATL